MRANNGIVIYACYNERIFARNKICIVKIKQNKRAFVLKYRYIVLRLMLKATHFCCGAQSLAQTDLRLSENFCVGFGVAM